MVKRGLFVLTVACSAAGCWADYFGSGGPLGTGSLRGNMLANHFAGVFRVRSNQPCAVQPEGGCSIGARIEVETVESWFGNAPAFIISNVNPDAKLTNLLGGQLNLVVLGYVALAGEPWSINMTAPDFCGVANSEDMAMIKSDHSALLVADAEADAVYFYDDAVALASEFEPRPGPRVCGTYANAPVRFPCTFPEYARHSLPVMAHLSTMRDAAKMDSHDAGFPAESYTDDMRQVRPETACYGRSMLACCFDFPTP